MPDDPTTSPPSAASLRALGSDGWAALLHAVRAVLARDDHGTDGELARFRDAPTSRLVGGRLRAALTERLASDPQLWSEIAGLARARPELPAELLALLASDRTDDRGGGESAGVGEGGGRSLTPEAEAAEVREALATAKQRVRDARQERDAWRRRAEGADARAERLEVALEGLHGQIDELRTELAEAITALDAAATERSRAVDRERRRRDGELVALEEQLAVLRREEEQRRTRSRRRAEVRRQAEREAQRSARDAQRRARDDAPPRVVPGRPSRLPRGVEPGTTEAARELLHRGRLTLVDGYNVTKQHRGHLELETQRNWLVQQLGVLVRQRGIRPIVVFDGQASGGSRPSAALREVEVRFTDAGISADDELVLAVEGTDEPVVVVTDDRELTARVTVSGADVIGTRPFLGVLP